MTVAGSAGVGTSATMFMSETGEQSGPRDDTWRGEMWAAVRSPDLIDKLDPHIAHVRTTISEAECLEFVTNKQSRMPVWLVQWAQGLAASTTR